MCFEIGWGCLFFVFGWEEGGGEERREKKEELVSEFEKFWFSSWCVYLGHLLTFFRVCEYVSKRERERASGIVCWLFGFCFLVLVFVW